MSEVVRSGDYVRVTIEGYHTNAHPLVEYGTHAGDERNWEYESTDSDTVTIEKLEPPVEVFKPGDRLRRKGLGNYEITLGDEGYLQHLASGRTVYAKYGADAPDFFNSENFEKLNIA